MKAHRISKEEAARLAQRDRNRIIGLAIFAVMVGGLYLYSSADARKKRAAEAAELEGSKPTRSLEAEDFAVIPFDSPDALELINDGDEASQQLLATEPLKVVFDYARMQTPVALRALGIREMTPTLNGQLVDAPADHRMEAYRVRGEILSVIQRPRVAGTGSDWLGSLLSEDGDVSHFLVATPPKQADGTRRIEVGDFLRVEGLFYGLYRTQVDVDGSEGEAAPAPLTGPLIVGARAEPSAPKLSAEIARLAPTLGEVRDDSIGTVFEPGTFEFAQWELMGRAALLGEETDWDAAPELDSEVLRQIFEDGESYRGKPFRLPVCVNLEGNSYGAPDNPLRIDRYSDGWIGNIGWKKPASVIRWIGPFDRKDLLRSQLDDDNRYVTARGYFFRNEVYTTSAGVPGRTPVFVMESVDIFTPEADPSIAWFAYGVLGLTIGLIGLIYLLLRADKKKSRELYDDMLRRKRARRDRATSAA